MLNKIAGYSSGVLPRDKTNTPTKLKVFQTVIAPTRFCCGAKTGRIRAKFLRLVQGRLAHAYQIYSLNKGANVD